LEDVRKSLIQEKRIKKEEAPHIAVALLIVRAHNPAQDGTPTLNTLPIA